MSNELQKTNYFTIYLVSVGLTLAANQTPTTLNPPNFPQNSPKSMGITHIEYIGIVIIIKLLYNSSPCWNGIPCLLAKTVINLYNLIPFSVLINTFFGIFPNELKLGKFIRVQL